MANLCFHAPLLESFGRSVITLASNSFPGRSPTSLPEQLAYTNLISLILEIDPTSHLLFTTTATVLDTVGVSEYSILRSRLGTSLILFS